ncbi:endonuclease MutS2 [soil metagenome]
MDSHTRIVLQFDLVLEQIAGRASSELGRDYVLKLDPSAKVGEIQERFGPVRDLMGLLNENQTLPLAGLSDVTTILDRGRIQGSALEEEHWRPLAVFIRICGQLVSFRDQNGRRFPALATLLSSLERHADLERAVEKTFDQDGAVRDDASPELNAARKGVRGAEQRLQRTIGRIQSDFHQRGILQENFATIRNGRHVFPIKAGSRGKATGIYHGASASGETMYVEPMEVVEASNDVETLREVERREVFRILLALTDLLRPSIGVLRDHVRILRQLDGCYALARTAVQKGWNIPTLVPDGAVRLFNAHHPLLNLRGGKSIPITMLLDRGDCCVVLSGPNAGGKTTAMKTLGLLALLAQCGCPIPAFPDSTIPVFSRVLADIGDQQDLQQGISTFSGHMRRIMELWNQADKRTLVLMDELGTGTDPQEGGALALALLEGFRERAEMTVTTSHLNPVKQWAEDTPGVRNASFSLDPSTHEPTYVLRLDLPGASEALEIAEKEGLPPKVLERARGLVGERHLRMGELLRRIEERERTLSTAAREAEARAKSLAEQEALARARAEMMRTERREMKEATLRERELSIAAVREKLETLIAQLPSEDDMARRREALVRAREEALREQGITAAERRGLAEQQQQTGELFVGQKVYVPSLRQWGEIAALESAKRLRVQLGNMEVMLKTEDVFDHDPAERRAEQKARAEDLEVIATGGRKGQKRGRRIRNALRDAGEYSGPVSRPAVTFAGRSIINVSRPVSMMLDLHGFRVEEALAALDRFLDQSLLAGYPYVKVNHGTGSGRLYKAVHEYLRSHPSVEKYRFAAPDEGGGGVTVVEL